MHRDAILYVDKGSKLKCMACIRGCILKPGAIGFCGNYQNIDGRLVNIGYGIISAHESRPIEIKPLFHFYPGSTSYTFSGWGCNFTCPWCQNFHLSRVKPRDADGTYIDPGDMVRYALISGDDGLCASFNEPVIHLEYLIDVFRISRRNGLYNVMVTNGSYTRDALDLLIEAGLDAVSMDIKGCIDAYRRYQSIGSPIEILRNAGYALDRGIHVESVFLIVTDANDDPECIKWVIDQHIRYLGLDTPIHINRYHPAYRYHRVETSMETLIYAYNYARDRGVKYVYIGNIPDTRYMNTYCPSCGRVVIYRTHYSLYRHELTEKNSCRFCGERINIVGRPRLSRYIYYKF